MTTDPWSPKLFRVTTGLALYALAVILAFAPVSAEVWSSTAGEPSVRKAECGLPVGLVFPIAGTPLWERNGEHVGPCLRQAHIRVIASICLFFLGTGVIFFTVRRRTRDERGRPVPTSRRF